MEAAIPPIVPVPKLLPEYIHLCHSDYRFMCALIKAETKASLSIIIFGGCDMVVKKRGGRGGGATRVGSLLKQERTIKRRSCVALDDGFL